MSGLQPDATSTLQVHRANVYVALGASVKIRKGNLSRSRQLFHRALSPSQRTGQGTTELELGVLVLLDMSRLQTDATSTLQVHRHNVYAALGASVKIL